jgi:hypothetical protein
MADVAIKKAAPARAPRFAFIDDDDDCVVGVVVADAAVDDGAVAVGSVVTVETYCNGHAGGEA